MLAWGLGPGAWGLGASAFGLLIVTNFRGFADNFARRAEASSAGLRKRPPWKWQLPPDPAEKTRRMRLPPGRPARRLAARGRLGFVAGRADLRHRHRDGLDDDHNRGVDNRRVVFPDSGDGRQTGRTRTSNVPD
jgi:hypothetical protein